MEKRARAILVSTAVILTIMLLWTWKNRPAKAELVQAGKASVQDIFNSVTISGTIEAANSIALCPEESGMVAAVYAQPGDAVEQGAVLCTLTALPRNDVTAPAKTILSALYATADKTVSATESNVLRAPASGTVLEIPEPGDTVIAGLPCIRIADLAQLQVHAQSPELYASELAAGQRANVTSSSAGEQVYGARVESIAPVAVRTMSLTGQSEEAVVETVLSLHGDVTGLRPGYSAAVKVFTDHHENAVVVPHEAVCQRGEQEYVFCIENGRAVQCAVTTGYMLESMTEIVEGIDAGATVILSPAESLADGAPVEVAV